MPSQRPIEQSLILLVFSLISGIAAWMCFVLLGYEIVFFGYEWHLPFILGWTLKGFIFSMSQWLIMGRLGLRLPYWVPISVALYLLAVIIHNALAPLVFEYQADASITYLILTGLLLLPPALGQSILLRGRMPYNWLWGMALLLSGSVFFPLFIFQYGLTPGAGLLGALQGLLIACLFLFLLVPARRQSLRPGY